MSQRALHAFALGMLTTSFVHAQDIWPLSDRTNTAEGPCGNALISAQARQGQCNPDTCNLGPFRCQDGSTIPGWKSCDGINDCPTSASGASVVAGTRCIFNRSFAGPCASDEVGGNCGGMIDTMVNSGISGVGADGSSVGINFSTAVNQRGREYVTTQLESSFRWSFYRAVAERRTAADCQFYMQKEMEMEQNYQLTFSPVVEVPDTSYYSQFGATPPTVFSPRVQATGDKVVYAEYRPSTGFVGTATFSFRIRSCDSRYLHTACALQTFDTGDIPVIVTVSGAPCGETKDYCGAHGRCMPVGGVDGKARDAGCQCESGWRGRDCSVEVVEPVYDDSHMFAVLAVGIFLVAAAVAVVWRFVLKQPWPKLCTDAADRQAKWIAQQQALIYAAAGWEMEEEAAAAAADGGDWELLVDEETGAEYWYSAATGETRWADDGSDPAETEDVGKAGEGEEPSVPAIPAVPDVPDEAATSRDNRPELPVRPSGSVSSI